MNKLILSTIAILLFVTAFAQQKTFNIQAFGAKGDAKTNNTKAIQSAINAAHKKGSGTVIIPGGYFVTGPLVLKSGVVLHLGDNAVLMGSTKRMDYGTDSAAPLIGAYGANRVSITGKGTINGQGRELVKDLFTQLHAGKLQDEQWRTKRPTEKSRPKMIAFTDCKNVIVKGVTIKNGATWIQDYINCDGVIIDSVNVESTEYWNNDGIDIVNSKNVRITNCSVDVADDAICLKSEGKPGICENIFVANCRLRSSASGFKLGTGSFGGFRNITVWDLYVYNTYRSAIALEAVDGGFLENIDIRNVTAKYTGNAIFIRLGHRNKDEKYSTVKNIYVADVRVEVPAGKPDIGYPVEGPRLLYPHNVFPASVTGIPGHPVKDVTLENIEIIYEGGASKAVAYFGTDSIERVPENMAGYPEFSMFGEVPAWGFYARHVEGLAMNNIKLSYKTEDYRPAVIFDDVKNLTLQNVHIASGKEAPVMIFNKVVNHSFERLTLPFGEKTGIRIK